MNNKDAMNGSSFFGIPRMFLLLQVTEVQYNSDCSFSCAGTLGHLGQTIIVFPEIKNMVVSQCCSHLMWQNKM